MHGGARERRLRETDRKRDREKRERERLPVGIVFLNALN